MLRADDFDWIAFLDNFSILQRFIDIDEAWLLSFVVAKFLHLEPSPYSLLSPLG